MQRSLNTHQRPGQLLLEALASLRSAGKRSVLALLGIAVASASVIAMINIGQNATADAISIFNAMGTHTLVASVDNASVGYTRPVTPADTDQLHQIFPQLTSVAPVALSYAQLKLRSQETEAQLVGATDSLVHAMNLNIHQGRFLSSFDQGQTFAVVGHQIAQALGTAARPMGIGDRIRLNEYVYVVIGLLEKQPDSLWLPVQTNRSVFIPLEGMRRVEADAQISSVIVNATPGQDMASLALRFGPALKRVLKGRDADIVYAQRMIDSLEHQSRTFEYLLLALSVISLTGAGIGIMNVMLMSVAQRRREIGVRMALGARRKDIRNLFLVEALALTVLGTTVGAVIGLAGAFVYAWLIGWHFSLASTALPLGVGSTLLVGLFCGLHPALAAARLQPVMALRDE